jgi:hypothetical protein
VVVLLLSKLQALQVALLLLLCWEMQAQHCCCSQSVKLQAQQLQQ